jgi:hypothetical protein
VRVAGDRESATSASFRPDGTRPGIGDLTGRLRPAPRTFERKGDAARWLSLKEAEISKGEWISPELGQQTFGDLAMGDIDEAAIRRWRKERLDTGPKAGRPFGPVFVAKAYRLRHAIFETASEQDRIIPRNPCRIIGDHRGGSGRIRRARDRSSYRRFQDRRSRPRAISLPRAGRHLRRHALG